MLFFLWGGGGRGYCFWPIYGTGISNSWHLIVFSSLSLTNEHGSNECRTVVTSVTTVFDNSYSRVINTEPNRFCYICKLLNSGLNQPAPLNLAHKYHGPCPGHAGPRWPPGREARRRTWGSSSSAFGLFPGQTPACRNMYRCKHNYFPQVSVWPDQTRNRKGNFNTTLSTTFIHWIS